MVVHHLIIVQKVHPVLQDLEIILSNTFSRSKNGFLNQRSKLNQELNSILI